MITYFSRNRKAGISIGKVFDTLLNEMSDYVQYEMPSYRSMPWSLLMNLWFIFSHRNRKGINHITGDIYYGVIALVGCKSVVTIHDLVMVDANKGLKKWIKGLFWFKIPSLLATEITFISEDAKKRFIAYTHHKKNNLHVIHNPVDKRYIRQDKCFNKSCPIILHIGTRNNKNLDRVIQALQGIKCHLRIVGDISAPVRYALQKNKVSYSVVSNISEMEMLHEYCQCDIVSFPSTYEGFGMPIIEGNAVGRIVITSNIAPMTEVAAEAAVYVNPFSVESIKEGFVRVISDEKLRNRIIANGYKNIHRFDSSIIMGQYQNLYTWM